MNRPLNIAFENEALLLVNKPAGLVCHPTKGDEWSSLVGRMRLAFGADHRVHLLNRLDRETSGLLLLAKGDEHARELRRLLEGGRMLKEYRALVHGWPATDRGTIDAAIGMAEQSEVKIRRGVRENGKAASTDFAVERRFARPEGRFALLVVRPRTGRTHQIRVHLAHLGHPIVGDKIYGGDERAYLSFTRRELVPEQWNRLLLPFQALHAGRLRFAWRENEVDVAVEPERWFADFAAGRPVVVGGEEAYA
jgi:23S rRNA pseudouridine1911/1915/1917 synthase